MRSDQVMASRALESATLAVTQAVAGSSPQYREVVVPARAAYSYSASLGSRHPPSPEIEFNQAMKRFASSKLTQTTGCESSCEKPGFRHESDGSFFHPRNPGRWQGPAGS